MAMPHPACHRGTDVKDLKGDVGTHPVLHHDERRIEPFIAFLACCLQPMLQRRLHALAPKLPMRSPLEKFAALPMIDVHLPTIVG